MSAVMRDREHNHEFLLEVARVAAARFNIPTDDFAALVERRLQLGDQLYGVRFLEKPLAEQALDPAEEGQDGGAYSAMIAQGAYSDLEDDTQQAIARHAFELACHAAAMDYHARAIRTLALEVAAA